MKKTRLVVATIALTLGMSFSALAGQWKQDSTGWWWMNSDGSYPTNGWRWIDGNGDGIFECYYFDSNGYLLTRTVTPDGYTVDSNGAWTVDGMVRLKTLNEINTSESPNSQSAPAPSSQVAPLFDFDIPDSHITYTNYRLTQDYDGNTCLVLYYNFTNKDSEAQSAAWADFYITVFQNGIECDTSFIWDDRDEAMDNYSKDVMQGTTINVAQVYELRDLSDVTIQIEELWNWSNPLTKTAVLQIQ